MNKVIISAFPGTGKTYLHRQEPDSQDSDSSLFSWLSPGVRNPEFPRNYMKHIMESESPMIFVSSHKDVRNALVRQGIPFYLVYPDILRKHEYIERYVARGNDKKFIDMIESKWTEFIEDCEYQTGCEHIVLQKGEYLSCIGYTKLMHDGKCLRVLNYGMRRVTASSLVPTI